ncbi:hypothetical protein E0698_24295 [Paenibacillus sp. 23TSA30-6]|nr:hypothetical protein [Paenibacillus sp. 23TSA30-6]
MIGGITPGTCFIVETLDEHHGFAILAWKAMGCPEPPTREQTRALQGTALATNKKTVYADIDGSLKLELTLTPWSLIAVREV